MKSKVYFTKVYSKGGVWILKFCPGVTFLKDYLTDFWTDLVSDFGNNKRKMPKMCFLVSFFAKNLITSTKF